MEVGIGPVSSLEYIDNTLSFDKFPMVKGMDPESLFSWRRMSSKLTKLPMEAGIGPVSSLKDIDKTPSALSIQQIC